MSLPFDPSLLYAECRWCGRPVVSLQPCGEALMRLGVPPSMLKADCLLLYEGCPSCRPGQAAYETRFVRLLPRHDPGVQ